MADVRAARTIEDLPEDYNAAADLIGANLAAGRSRKTALIDLDGPLSYAELADSVERMADALHAQGIRREQRILLCLVDTRDFPILFLGAIRAGIVPVPLNTLLTASDYIWILRDSGAAAVFVSGELTGGWRDIAASCSDVKFFSSGEGPWPSVASLFAAAAPGDAARTHRDEPAFWLYTSGSTGTPKGAIHVHGSPRLTANLYAAGVAGYSADDMVLSVAKQFFAYGLGNSLTFPYAVGATAILNAQRSTPDAISALLRKHPVSVLAGVPTFFAAWMASADAPARKDMPRLRLATSAGEPLPSHLSEAFAARYGVDLIDGLGSTELLHIFLSQRPGEVRHGCTGRPVPGYELRLVDDDGRETGDGQIGELLVRGPTAASGYWRNRPKTRRTFEGEWTRTGDKYMRGADGWFTCAGRADDMLKVGGVYVAPAEVEEALCRHEAVLEAAVVGAPDGDGLIKPRAHIVLNRGFRGDTAQADALKAHVKTLLAPYKYPRWFVFEDELPKTATGKIQRFRLRDAADRSFQESRVS